MAKKPPVHVEPRERGWAVIREGSERASSLHPTQAEAAKEGRNTARREETEFFLHAQDGRVREHRSYGAGPRLAKEEVVVGQAAKTLGAVTRGTSAAPHALGAGEEADQAEGPTNGGSSDRASGEEPSDTEEVRGLTDAKYDDRFGTPGERYAGYEVYDQDGERIGKPDDLFVDDNDNLEYVGVRMSPSGTGFILVPADVVAVDVGLRRMVVSASKRAVVAGPTYGANEEVTPEFEKQVRGHYGLASGRGADDKGDYGAYYGDEEQAETRRTGSSAAGPAGRSAETGEVRGGDREGSVGFDRNQADKDELRVRRIEEDLKVGTREREAGAVRVRKRVRTDHERIVVPKKRVEVTVERVPVEGQAVAAGKGTAEPEIREDEIVVPVIEEEIVVEKRPVVKEEIRIRKGVVEDSEVVEEDVRREEVEIDDETTQRDL